MCAAPLLSHDGHALTAGFPSAWQGVSAGVSRPAASVHPSVRPSCHLSHCRMTCGFGGLCLRTRGQFVCSDHLFPHTHLLATQHPLQPTQTDACLLESTHVNVAMGLGTRSAPTPAEASFLPFPCRALMRFSQSFLASLGRSLHEVTMHTGLFIQC